MRVFLKELLLILLSNHWKLAHLGPMANGKVCELMVVQWGVEWLRILQLLRPLDGRELKHICPFWLNPLLPWCKMLTCVVWSPINFVFHQELFLLSCFNHWKNCAKQSEIKGDRSCMHLCFASDVDSIWEGIHPDTWLAVYTTDDNGHSSSEGGTKENNTSHPAHNIISLERKSNCTSPLTTHYSH